MNAVSFFTSIGNFSLDISVKIPYNIRMKPKITFHLDKELCDFLKQYAKQNHRSVTQLLVDYIFDLQKKEKQNEFTDA